MEILKKMLQYLANLLVLLCLFSFSCLFSINTLKKELRDRNDHRNNFTKFFRICVRCNFSICELVFTMNLSLEEYICTAVTELISSNVDSQDRLKLASFGAY